MDLASATGHPCQLPGTANPMRFGKKWPGAMKASGDGQGGDREDRVFLWTSDA